MELRGGFLLFGISLGAMCSCLRAGGRGYRQDFIRGSRPDLSFWVSSESIVLVSFGILLGPHGDDEGSEEGYIGIMWDPNLLGIH